MRKTLTLILSLTLLGFGYSGVSTAGAPEDVHWRTEGPLARWLEKPVYNLQGVELGEITQFAAESGQEVRVAALHDFETDRSYAVPMAALSFDEEGDLLLLDVSKQELRGAPVFQRGKEYDRQDLERLHSYYGVDDVVAQTRAYYEDRPAERRVMVEERTRMIEPMKDVRQWIGKEVINSNGQHLGVMTGFIVDEQGRIIFGMVESPELDRRLAVPHSAFNFAEGREYVLLDIDERRFASAPLFTTGNELMDRSYIEENYRYFGERPYWTEVPEETEMRRTDRRWGYEGMKRAPQELEPEDY